MKRSPAAAILLVAVVAILAAAPASSAASTGEAVATGRRIAITIDDLPKAGDSGVVEETRRTTEAILAALRAHRAPAVGFVNESGLHVDDQIDARVGILRAWVDAGMVLGNHTFSHLRLHDTPLSVYQDDVIHGEVITRRLMEARPRAAGASDRAGGGIAAGAPGGDVVARPGCTLWFRHPATSTGATAEIKRAFEAFLAERGYRVAPFTVENADYIFNQLLRDARHRGDSALAARVRAAYLDHLDVMVAYFEGLSRETFGREIPQILLVHASDLNEIALDEALARLERRGYAFVTLEEATADPAYATPDLYVGPAGPSWLHRWSLALGRPMRLREEPDPPAWVLDRWREIRGAPSPGSVPRR